MTKSAKDTTKAAKTPTKVPETATDKAVSINDTKEEASSEVVAPEKDDDGPQVRPYPFSEFCEDVIWAIKSLFVNPDFTGLIILPLLILESLVCQLIIANVPFTDIDFTTYMQQIDQIEKGELDYNNIAGDTGAIVYPGGYVWIYRVLKWLSDNMESLGRAQATLRFVYVLTLLMAFISYRLTSTRIPPWVFYLLVLSKRIHSIYVLRMFNDCFTTFFTVFAVLMLQTAARLKKWEDPEEAEARKAKAEEQAKKAEERYIAVAKAKAKAKREFRVFDEVAEFGEPVEVDLDFSELPIILTFFASFLYSVAISIKMNALLYLPGFLLVIYQILDENLLTCIPVLIFGLLTQVAINYKFLIGVSPEIRQNFLQAAYNFHRQFLYTWTVNWKFLPESVFTNQWFQLLLLVLHVATLAYFILTRWLSPNITGKSVKQFFTDFYSHPVDSSISRKNVMFTPQAGNYVLWVMALTNTIGVLFSRSLHYQFLSWYFWSLPYLLYNCGFHPLVTIALAALHEWCWEVYPATPASSLVLVVILATVVARNYILNPLADTSRTTTPDEVTDETAESKKDQ